MHSIYICKISDSVVAHQVEIKIKLEKNSKDKRRAKFLS